MRLFKKISKRFSFSNQHLALMIWLELVVLSLILALSVYASFIFSQTQKANRNLSGLETRLLRLANDQAQINQKLDGVQTMMLRLQSQTYRSSLPEEKN